MTNVLAEADRRRRRQSRTGHVLCVDDDPQVLQGLRDNLRKTFDVEVAASGAEGLAMLRQDPDRYAIVISDMRMPVMPGSVFLREARRVSPNAIRMLLTGHADVDSAIRTVNDGQLFRFLTKPCAPEHLRSACGAAMTKHRLVVAERVLIGETLRESVMALTDVLALTHPAAFGRGTRVKSVARRLAHRIEMPDAWKIEPAAMLAQVGAVVLPEATADKLYAGEALTKREAEMVAQLPETTQRMVAEIPHLEGVAEVLANVGRPFDSASDLQPLPLGARMLRIIFDYDRLESGGARRALSVETMRWRRGVYDRELLDAFVDTLSVEPDAAAIREVTVGALAVGMTIAEDVRSHRGALLVTRGHPVTEALLDRVGNLDTGQVREPVRVIEQDG